MNSTLYGSIKRADYEIGLLEEEQKKLIKKGIPRTMRIFRVCCMNGRTVHRKKETL